MRPHETGSAVQWRRFGYTYNVHSGDDSVEEYILWKGVVIPPEERDKIRVFDLNDGIAVEVK